MKIVPIVVATLMLAGCTLREKSAVPGYTWTSSALTDTYSIFNDATGVEVAEAVVIGRDSCITRQHSALPKGWSDLPQVLYRDCDLARKAIESYVAAQEAYVK